MRSLTKGNNLHSEGDILIIMISKIEKLKNFGHYECRWKRCLDLTTYSLEEEPSHPYYTTTSNLTQPKRGVEVEEAR